MSEAPTLAAEGIVVDQVRLDDADALFEAQDDELPAMCHENDQERALFTERLNAHLASEFGASQQYVAMAVWYDNETLPQLARHFSRSGTTR
jgi:hypothetical protein